MSFVIDLKLASTLRTHLEEQGYTFTQPPYTLFSAKKPGLSVTLYTSGKLLVQGKDKEDFIKYYLEPELLGTFQFPSPHIGVDESGKGDFFGPLCIAGVFADETMLQSLIKHGVRDSKTIKDTTIKTLAPIIQSICPHECIILYPKKYNELYTNFGNLNALLAWGHATVIEQLHKKTGCKEAHIDQFASEHVVEKALARKNIAISLSQSRRANLKSGKKQPLERGDVVQIFPRRQNTLSKKFL